ncbi:hypothetical protein DITRI_Ditri01bG0018700 [Diplodiscus trichospermus]
MFKKSPSRNLRSKSIKLKHVLQICLLLGVCFWLIYQVKRSHDRRKEFDEKDAKASVKAQSDDLIIKLGRKDLPHVQEVSKNYKYEEEEEEENGVEENKHDEEREEKAKRLEEEEEEENGVEENKHDEEWEEKAKRLEEEEREGASKHEEEELEEGSKHEEEEQEEARRHEEEEQEEASKNEEEQEIREEEGGKHDDEEQEAEIKDEEAEDEGRGDGEDEVDENEQDRADGETDHEEEFIDEEKEREAEGDDKENEEKENEEKEGQEESDKLENDQDHDGGGRNAHEAREEHYKADDASSAVSHDTRIINSEADNSTMNVLEQESKANTTEETNGDENKSELKDDEGKNSEGGSSLNVTYAKENDHEIGSSNSISLPNTTQTTAFIEQASYNSTEVSKETGNKPAEVNTEMPGSLQNGTSAQNTTEDGMVTEEKYKEQANETISDGKQPGSNAVDSSKIENVDSATRDSLNGSTNAESGMSEDVARINATAAGDSFGSSTKETTSSNQNEKSEGDNESSGTDESSDASSANETVDVGQQDPIDSSDNALHQEEKDSRVDLSTLPDITTEGSNNEDAAAE